MFKIDEIIDIYIYFFRNAIDDLKIIYINKYIYNYKIKYVIIYKLCCKTSILNKNKLFVVFFYFIIKYNCFKQLYCFIEICFFYNDYNIILLYNK